MRIRIMNSNNNISYFFFSILYIKTVVRRSWYTVGLYYPLG